MTPLERSRVQGLAMGYILIVIAVLFLICLASRPSDKSETADSPADRLRANPNDQIISIVSPLDDATSIRRTFRNVFTFVGPDRHAALISYYRAKHHCGEIEAMKFAIIDRQNDEERFR